jgi:hypothetical protein
MQLRGHGVLLMHGVVDLTVLLAAGQLPPCCAGLVMMNCCGKKPPPPEQAPAKPGDQQSVFATIHTLLMPAA